MHEVWEPYDDIAGTPRWVPYVERVLYVSGPARVGTVYREQTRLGMVRGTSQWEIVEHDRRRGRQVYVSTDMRLVAARRVHVAVSGAKRACEGA